MIVTFCGHRDTRLSQEEKQNLVALLRSVLHENHDALFYLGDYGSFDGVCNALLRQLKQEFPDLKRIFVTPYLYPQYGHLQYADLYDEVLYPFDERVMPKYAIARRNKWMVDRADRVIAYVRYGWGGAYTTFAYAKQRKKRIDNICMDGTLV